jgi:hypothetical protein
MTTVPWRFESVKVRAAQGGIANAGGIMAWRPGVALMEKRAGFGGIFERLRPSAGEPEWLGSF